MPNEIKPKGRGFIVKVSPKDCASYIECWVDRKTDGRRLEANLFDGERDAQWLLDTATACLSAYEWLMRGATPPAEAEMNNSKIFEVAKHRMDAKLAAEQSRADAAEAERDALRTRFDMLLSETFSADTLLLGEERARREKAEAERDALRARLDVVLRCDTANIAEIQRADALLGEERARTKKVEAERDELAARVRVLEADLAVAKADLDAFWAKSDELGTTGGIGRRPGT